MPLDPARATFVSHEYRYAEKFDSTVKALYPDARLIEINTNLSAASADALATSYLNDQKTSAIALEVTVDGALNLSDFMTGPNRYTLVSETYQTAGRTFKLAGAQVDYLRGITTLRLRG